MKLFEICLFFFSNKRNLREIIVVTGWLLEGVLPAFLIQNCRVILYFFALFLKVKVLVCKSFKTSKMTKMWAKLFLTKIFFFFKVYIFETEQNLAILSYIITCHLTTFVQFNRLCNYYSLQQTTIISLLESMPS